MKSRSKYNSNHGNKAKWSRAFIRQDKYNSFTIYNDDGELHFSRMEMVYLVEEIKAALKKPINYDACSK